MLKYIIFVVLALGCTMAVYGQVSNSTSANFTQTFSNSSSVNASVAVSNSSSVNASVAVSNSSSANASVAVSASASAANVSASGSAAGNVSASASGAAASASASGAVASASGSAAGNVSASASGAAPSASPSPGIPSASPTSGALPSATSSFSTGASQSGTVAASQSSSFSFGASQSATSSVTRPVGTSSLLPGTSQTPTPQNVGICGNGVVEGTEQCDPGITIGANGRVINNFKGPSCCNINCAFMPGNAKCGRAQPCFKKPRCNGSGTCQAPVQKPVGKLCRTGRRRRSPTGRCTAAGVCQ